MTSLNTVIMSRLINRLLILDHPLVLINRSVVLIGKCSVERKESDKMK